MNPRTRQIALYAIAVLAVLAGADALAHSYTGLYQWAEHHRLGGWQALSWPAEIDVFLVVGELALYVAYLDGWPVRQRIWPWVTAVLGLVVSVAGNIGHVQALPGLPVTAADRVTAAASPVAAFAGLLIGLLVLKMSRQVAPALSASVRLELVADSDAPEVPSVPAGEDDSPLVRDAVRIIASAEARGQAVSQRSLAAQLRELGYRFSNAQLGSIAHSASAENLDHAA
jgi:hypothetical protein